MPNNLHLRGNTVVNLHAEPEENVLIDPSGNDWKGMLIYVDPENDSEVKITSTAEVNITYDDSLGFDVPAAIDLVK